MTVQTEGRPVSAAELTLPVTGMTCASCVRRIERALAKVEGVASASVNLATERAQVRFAAAPVPVPVLRAAVERAGYGVRTERTVLAIRGLADAAGAERVRKALAALEGVESAQVNLAAENAVVKHIPHVTGYAELKAAVTAAGYEAGAQTQEEAAIGASPCSR